MKKTNFFPSKLLLFGEYTVLLGGRALSIPYPDYFGTWTKQASADHPSISLAPFAAYLSTINNQFGEAFSLDVHQFEKDIAQGWFFESTIPMGYGAGSSGALVAAVFSRYGQYAPAISPEELRKPFAMMESFFHGHSSGIDPLVSYFGRAVSSRHNQLLLLDKHASLEDFGMSVIDSGLPRETSPLVQLFNEKYQNDAAFRTVIQQQLIPQIDLGITAYLTDNKALWKSATKAISKIQYHHLSFLIPDHILTIWESGLESGDYALKLCGAGGGGFFLKIEYPID